MDFTPGVNMVISVRIVKLNLYHRLLAAFFGAHYHPYYFYGTRYKLGTRRRGSRSFTKLLSAATKTAFGTAFERCLTNYLSGW
jgi:hypothetical protein